MDADRRQRLRAVLGRQREAHRKIFDIQGEAIAALRDAITAISRTHDEMIALFDIDNDLEEHDR